MIQVACLLARKYYYLLEQHDNELQLHADEHALGCSRFEISVLAMKNGDLLSFQILAMLAYK